MWLMDKALKRLIKQGTLTVIEPGGKTHSYGKAEAGWPDLTLRLHDDKVANFIARNPRLGAGEAYMDGRFSVEGGDIMDFVTLVGRNNSWERGGKIEQPGPLKAAAKAIIGRVNRINRHAASKANVAHHYDLNDRLYDLFLDADRQYSCAYWTDPGNESLEQAQKDKMAHIAAKLALQPGQRVLDIGCGWGGMALYLNRVAGVELLGVTLSEEQLKVARQRAEAAGVADKVKFELIDYRDVEGRFDRIVSVGMFEHVGPANYNAFFRKCHDLLTDDGVMLLHSIGRINPPGVTDAWTRKYIFPGGYSPSLSEVLAASEPNRLIMTDCETLRRHYAYTLREWYKRCVKKKAEIVALYDERFYRMWTFYLAGATNAFENGGMVNYQYQYARSRDALPLTRDYIAEAEATYRAMK